MNIRTIAGLLVAAALSSCGGGEEERCSSESAVFLTITWNSNGQVGQNVRGKVGTPLVATPTVTGVPASCRGQESYHWSSLKAMPAGLRLDAASGVISGTPTQAVRVTEPPGTASLVELWLPGYRAVKVLYDLEIAP